MRSLRPRLSIASFVSSPRDWPTVALFFNKQAQKKFKLFWIGIIYKAKKFKVLSLAI